MKDDLGALANQLDGWQSDERLLRDVGIEAVRAHPGTYARGVTRTVWRLGRWPILRPEPSTESDTNDGAAPGAGDTIVVDGRRLPRPTEGQRIPASHFAGPTSPDGSIYAVWTSPYEFHLVFVHAGDEERYNALHRRIDELAARHPRSRVGNRVGRALPGPGVAWDPSARSASLVLGVVGLALRRPQNALALATPAIAAVAVVVLSALAIEAIPYYSVPVTPAFLLLTAGWLVAPRAG